MDKWVCKKCGKEIFYKPKKNQTCECTGRFRHFTTCRDCGEWFYNPLNDATRCPVCRSPKVRHERLWVKLSCANCGKEFERLICNIKGEGSRVFCSKKCMKEHFAGQRVERTCNNCGKKFVVRKSALGETTNASGNYCSKECYWESMTVESDKCYKGFRPAKHKHFGGVQFCAICGTTKGIHIHHIVPNRLTHDQSADNLIPICKRCHPKIETITRGVLKVSTDYEKVKFYMNNILRTRQYATFAMIKALRDKKTKTL